MKKKVDERVRTLIENGVKSRTRSLFVIVGDRGKDQVANLHYILSKAQVKARPTVLWCYNKELGFSTCVNNYNAPALGKLLKICGYKIPYPLHPPPHLHL